MTTLTIPQLERLLRELGLKVPIPHYESVDVLNKPLDIGRSYLADIISELAECDFETAYKSIHWPNNIYNGDLVVILPKLKPGVDANQLGVDLTRKVINAYSIPLYKVI
jgi:arginyl-tRNA synthetase